MPAALAPADVGQVLTPQRAASVTGAQAHRDLHLRPLAQTLADLHAELGERAALAGASARRADSLPACGSAAAMDAGRRTPPSGRLPTGPSRQGPPARRILVPAGCS